MNAWSLPLIAPPRPPQRPAPGSGQYAQCFDAQAGDRIRMQRWVSQVSRSPGCPGGVKGPNGREDPEGRAPAAKPQGLCPPGE